MSKRYLTNIEKRAYIGILSGMFTLGIGVYSLWKHNKLEEDIKSEKDLNKLSERIYTLRQTQILSNIFTGIIGLATALQILLAYMPNESELALTKLIEYLHKTGAIKSDIFEMLATYKPYRIEHHM
jgi:Tfp pilus assembly protein PilO